MQIHIEGHSFRIAENPEDGSVLLSILEPDGHCVVAHIESDRWKRFVEFANDPEGFAARDAARRQIAIPAP